MPDLETPEELEIRLRGQSPVITLVYATPSTSPSPEPRLTFDEMYEIVLKTAVEVNEKLGYYYPERAYQRLLQVYLENRHDFVVDSEYKLPVYVDGVMVVERRADLVIWHPHRLVIECKARWGNITGTDLLQVNHYQKLLKFRQGVVINFASKTGYGESTLGFGDCPRVYLNTRDEE